MRARVRPLAKLGLLFFGIVGAVAPAEVALRLRDYDTVQFQWLSMVNPSMLELTGNPDLPYVLSPGTRGRIWNTEVSVNSSGFRGREIQPDKGDRFRVAAIGDSITFGMDIADPSQLYPARLEGLLRAGPRHRSAEVLNLGVTGYDAINDLEHLRLRGLRLRPDVVVWQICVNDIGTASTALSWVKAATRLRNPVFKLRLARFVLSRTLRILALREAERDNELERFTAEHRGQILPIDDDATLRQDMARIAAFGDRPELGFLRWWKEPPRLGFLEYAFAQMKALQQQQGFEVVVFAVPQLTRDYTDGWRSINDIVRHEAVKSGFRFVDVFDRFEARGPEQLRNLETDDIHPSPEGHAIIARALYDELAGSHRLAGW